MKKFSFLFLFVSLIFSAQNNRVIYEYKFRPDSTKVDSLRTEWMYLDIKLKQFENDPVQSMR